MHICLVLHVIVSALMVASLLARLPQPDMVLRSADVMQGPDRSQKHCFVKMHDMCTGSRPKTSTQQFQAKWNRASSKNDPPWRLLRGASKAY